MEIKIEHIILEKIKREWGKTSSCYTVRTGVKITSNLDQIQASDTFALTHTPMWRKRLHAYWEMNWKFFYVTY